MTRVKIRKNRAAATAATLMLLPLAAACGEASGSSSSCDDFTFAALDDDSHRAAYYGLETGEVASDLLGDLKIDYLQIPALIQATGAGIYDVLPTSLPALIRAREEGGIDLRVAGMIQAQLGGGIKTYVPADSPLESGSDLAGHTVGVVSFGSSVMPVSQYVYAEKYGLDSSLEGGEIDFVELDPSTLLAALKKGDVDAAILFHQAGWAASQDESLRVLVADDVEYNELTGAWPVGGLYVVEPDTAENKAKCVAEFQRVVSESVAYAKAHVTDFSDEISAETGVDAAFIEYWWDGQSYDFGATVDEEWVGWATTYYTEMAEAGLLPEAPDFDDMIIEETS
jgi:ABC-type nitrate/sulfonate/bicarbonate transport system substrate-binding protein